MDYLLELIKGKQHIRPQCKMMEYRLINYFSCISLLFFLRKLRGQTGICIEVKHLDIHRSLHSQTITCSSADESTLLFPHTLLFHLPHARLYHTMVSGR